MSDATVKQIAETLDGLQYMEEPTDDIIKIAKESGIVIVFGASDDLMEFRGAVYDEVGCYDGGTVYFNSSGLVRNVCDDDDCPYAEKEMAKATPVHALWCDGDVYSWTYKTDIPHETFEVKDGDDKFCKGIVFKLSDINN